MRTRDVVIVPVPVLVARPLPLRNRRLFVAITLYTLLGRQIEPIRHNSSTDVLPLSIHHSPWSVSVERRSFEIRRVVVSRQITRDSRILRVGQKLPPSNDDTTYTAPPTRPHNKAKRQPPTPPLSSSSSYHFRSRILCLSSCVLYCKEDSLQSL